MFDKYGSYRINVNHKINLFFYFTVMSENLVQIGPLITEIEVCGEKNMFNFT